VQPGTPLNRTATHYSRARMAREAQPELTPKNLTPDFGTQSFPARGDL